MIRASKIGNRRNTGHRPKPESGHLLTLPVPTREGIFMAHYSETGLAALNFPEATGRKPFQYGGRRSEAEMSITDPTGRLRQKIIMSWHRLTTAALKAVLAGRAAKRLPPLDWTGKTEFQQAVWRQLLELGPGKTKSYGEIADAIGKPKAVRAVGGACGANPIPVLVPCHRVLAANRKTGGFSGGLDWKRSLLAGEGVKL